MACSAVDTNVAFKGSRTVQAAAQIGRAVDTNMASLSILRKPCKCTSMRRDGGWHRFVAPIIFDVFGVCTDIAGPEEHPRMSSRTIPGRAPRGGGLIFVPILCRLKPDRDRTTYVPSRL